MRYNLFKSVFFGLTLSVFFSPLAIATEEMLDDYSYSRYRQGNFLDGYHNTHAIYLKGTNHQQHKGPSSIYNGEHQVVNYSKVPYFHPYQPFDNDRLHQGIISTPLVVHIPNDCKNNLPSDIKDELQRVGIQDQHLAIFLSSQNLPWNPDSVICFRPQYATDPIAPSNGGYWAIRNLRMGLFYSDTQGVKFTGSQLNSFKNDAFSTHPEGSSNPNDGRQGNTVLSGDSPHVDGLYNNGVTIGQSVWSYLHYNDGTHNRAIVTLHWLLSDEQNDALQGQLDQVFNGEVAIYPRASKPNIDLSVLVEAIGADDSFLNKGGHVAKLKSLLEL